MTAVGHRGERYSWLLKLPTVRRLAPSGQAAFAGDPILISKIRAPAIPAWAVQRHRITKRIAEGARWCPLTVVTGAPGAGKTMAVALWAAAEAGPVAWVGLDEFDNEPDTFWNYVLAALRRSGVALPPKSCGPCRPAGTMTTDSCCS